MSCAESYLNGSIEKYLKDLSGRNAVPGGGSVAALTASLGLGLSLMAINYSFGKGLSEEQEDKLLAVKKMQEENLQELSSLVDKDCHAFKDLMDTLSEKKDAQDKYISAAEKPLEVCRRVLKSMEQMIDLLPSFNENLITDVSCAGYTLKAASLSARVNVLINLKYIKDNDFVKKV